MHAQRATAGITHPTVPNEFITLFAHFHRAEVARMAGWRDRIDRTTNWTITLVAAMLSVSLSAPSAHHSVLVFAMILTFLMLMIESRRYRFFDVYRSRVRKLERNYYAKLFTPELQLPSNWQAEISQDLTSPTFTMPMREAVSRRLRRNYVWVFLILLIAWIIKIASSGNAGGIHPAIDLQEWTTNAAVGPLSGALVITTIAAFYALILISALRNYRGSGELIYGNAHV